MSQFRRNSLVALLVLGLASASTQAVVIIDYASISPPAIGFGNRSMPGIVIQSEAEFQMQRARAWHGYKRTDPKTGAKLVYPVQIGAIGSPTSARQVEVRSHISRAHAYRLESNKR